MLDRMSLPIVELVLVVPVVAVVMGPTIDGGGSSGDKVVGMVGKVDTA